MVEDGLPKLRHRVDSMSELCSLFRSAVKMTVRLRRTQGSCAARLADMLEGLLAASRVETGVR